MSEKSNKPKRWRSPSYPSISLPTAVEKAKVIMDKEGQHLTAIDVAAKHFKYKAVGGGINQLIAALSYFGLIQVEGMKERRKIKVTEDAYRIIMDTREVSSERDQLLRELALKPALYKEIYDKWLGDFPSDESLKHYLVVERKFNPNNVNEFMKDLKESFQFAKLYDTDILSKEEKSKTEGESDSGGKEKKSLPDNGGEKPNEEKPPKKDEITPPKPPSRYEKNMNEREIANYPVGENSTIRLIASGDITLQSIETLIDNLQIYKKVFPKYKEKSCEDNNA